MSNIFFFPRNLLDQQLYLSVAKFISENIKVYILKEKLDYQVSKNIYFISYENEVINLLKKTNNENWEKSLEKKFVLTKNKNYLFYEREFNYFPEYFGYDRFSYEHQCKYLFCLYEVLSSIFTKFKPKLVVSELLTGITDAVIKDLSKPLKYKYIAMRPSKILNGTVFCNPTDDHPLNLGNDNFKINMNELNQLILNINNSTYSSPQYMEIAKKKFNFFKISRVKTLIQRIKIRKNYQSSLGLYRYPVLNPLRYFLKKTRNTFFSRLYKKYFFRFKDIKNGKFFFLPLHFEPESSTMVRAFDWADQLSVIRLLSRQIPPPYFLVIKDHKGNEGYRDNSFFKTISYLPNVKIVQKEENPYEIISNAVGVICLTGRIGFESYVLNKPVAVFGDVFYEKWPHATKIKSFLEINQWCRSCITQKNIEFSNQLKKKYIKSYLKNVYDFKIVMGLEETLSNKNTKKIANFFEKILSEI